MTDDLVPSNESTERRAAPDSERVVKLWQTFTRMYGHAFVSQYGEKPDQVWAWAIARTSDEEVKRGLEGCLEAGGEFPPSLPKFMEYCNPPPAGVRFLGTPVDPRYLLDTPKASLETAQKHIANMRRVVGCANAKEDSGAL